MSLLTPLYLLALAGVSLPIVFHLIRRTPTGRTPFSSLMFLKPSPPKLTRRSRIDNLLLLILRAAALILLAMAFSRPFFREAENLAFNNTPGRRLAILLDTSASMRRADLWQQALRLVRSELDQLEAGDDVALMTFDQRVTPRVDFESDQAPETMAKANLIRQQLDDLAPTWGASQMGAALVTAADALAVANDLNQSDAALQVVLVSDLQRGAALAALERYEWPAQVQLAVRSVTPPPGTNATLRIVASEEERLEQEVRVRVSNAADSVQDQFQLQWEGGETAGVSRAPLSIYVPPGQSTIVRVPRAKETVDANQLVLSGDDHGFDNRFFTVPLQRESVTIGYIGKDEADDPDGLRYYLELALSDTFRRDVTVLSLAADTTAELIASQPDLVVVAQAVSPQVMAALDAFLRQGGAVFTVLHERELALQLVSFTEDAEVLAAESRASDDYVMFGEVDYTHPLFAIFADPHYSDFTDIHFWKHIRVQLDEEPARQVLARFDDGSPAFWEQPVGEGKLYVLTSGWRPADSQLALSTKFVPLVAGILDQAVGTSVPPLEYTVGETVRLPVYDSRMTIEKPDQARRSLESGETEFRDADQPGIYQLRWDNNEGQVAVNLASRESLTDALDPERLEQLGVRIGSHPTRSDEIERERQLRDMELEGQQKIWQWLVALVLGLLCCETWLAGRRARQLQTGR